MRILYGAVILAVGLGVGCAGRDDNPQTPTAQAPAPAPAPAPAAAAAGAQVTIAAHEAAMKQIAQANGALNKSLKSGDLPGVQTQAKILATQFTLVENFWTQRNKPDATKVAAGARQGAVTMSTAADIAAAQAAQPAVGTACGQCHKVYREGMPGDYRIAASAGITQ
jgi:cytochrome c556